MLSGTNIFFALHLRSQAVGRAFFLHTREFQTFLIQNETTVHASQHYFFFVGLIVSLRSCSLFSPITF